MTKKVLCEFCRRKAFHWIGYSGIPVCNRAECKAQALDRLMKLNRITKEEEEIYGEE